MFPLALCGILLLGLIAPVWAAEEPPQGRVYRASADSPYQVDFNREVDFNRIPLRFDAEDLYWGDGDNDYDTFALLWDEAKFNTAVAQGETEFTMTGEYGLSEWSSAELVALWNAGLVTMPEPPKLLVHIRPRDYVTVYSIPDEEIVLNVHRSTPFEEAIHYQDTVTLRPAEGANPYDDPLTVDFGVTWNREEYEAGIVSGAETFPVTGTYGEPDWDKMKGWVVAEGTPSLTVQIKQPPSPPSVYYDPAFVRHGTGSADGTHYILPESEFASLHCRRRCGCNWQAVTTVIPNSFPSPGVRRTFPRDLSPEGIPLPCEESMPPARPGPLRSRTGLEPIFFWRRRRPLLPVL